MRRDFPPLWMLGTAGVTVPIGAPLPKLPPFLIDDLLRDHLELPEDTPVEVRDAAVTRWLADNDPCCGLVMHLRMDGYYRRREGSRAAARAAYEADFRAAFARAVADGLVDLEFADPPPGRGKIGTDAHHATGGPMTETTPEPADLGVETPEADAVEQAQGDPAATTPRDVRTIPDDVPEADALEQAYEVELDDDYRG